MNIEQLERQLKKDIDLIGTIDSLSKLEPVVAIPFGIFSLDKLTGNNGAPKGLITEIFGRPSSGKTSLALNLITQAQKQKIKCCYIDVELALNKELAVQSGVDPDDLIVIRPGTGEEVFEVVESMSEKGFGLIVVDSIASISAESELESDYQDQTMGLQARLISKAMRKIIGCIARNKTALVFINQIRAVMAKMPGQKTTTTSGGISIPFYAALRLEMSRTGWIKDENKINGMTVKIRSEKNKLHRPQLETEVDFIFGTGFDTDSDKLNVMLEEKLIERVGNTYFFNNEKIGNKEKVIQWIRENGK